NFSFVNVLTQIGLGYTFVFLILKLRPMLQLAIALAILVGYGAAFAYWPAPTDKLVLQDYRLETEWVRQTGIHAHWEKNTNVAAAFDQWFLNKFPRPDGKPFKFNDGGYQTLNFVPSIATMIFGVLAGGWLRSNASKSRKAGMLFLAGAFC